MGIGTLINATGVLLGGALGILIGHRISKNIQQAIMKAAGISVAFLGIIGACEHALKINDGKIIYDTCGFTKEILQKCKTIYDNGPDKICEEEKRDKMLEIKSEIKKLESKDEFEEFEYDFFINIALRDLIRMYYIKNDKWVPKDKKLLKSIKKDDKNIYDILKNESFNKYEMLLKIYKYIK